MEELHAKLTRFGLSPKEADIYCLLVQEGEADATSLGRRSNSNRTVVYNVLSNLVKKGVVSFVRKGGKRYYQPQPPERFLVAVDEKRILAEGIIKDVCAITPVRDMGNSVEVLEGPEGLKAIQRDMLKPDEICVLNATGLIRDVLRYSRGLLKEFSKKRIRIIANPDYALPEIDAQVKRLPAKNYATTFIFDGHVVIQIIKDDIFIVKIRNQLLYEGYLQNFELLWGLI
ncbi:MAG: TrmB family transcriptional regulator [Nanoarchaeota archaeon]